MTESTPTLSEALQVTFWAEAGGKLSPPFGDVTATAGSVWSATVKLASLASAPAFPAASCAVTRTSSWPVGALGTFQESDPEFAIPAASELQLDPPLDETSTSTVVTAMLSEADQRMFVLLPATSVSPPLGHVTVTVGASWSPAGAPELVSVSAIPGAMTESTPPGCHTALMRIMLLATLSQAAFGDAPEPVSVQ